MTIRFYQQILLVCLGALLLGGCALPRPDSQQRFVPNRELLAVSLARQGLGEIGRSRFIEAELLLRQALYLFPDARNVKLNLALAISQLGQTEEARAIYEDFLKSAPASLDVHLALASLYHSSGDFAATEDFLLRALTLATAHGISDKAIVVKQSLASLYFETGREEEALCLSDEALAGQSDADRVFSHLRLLVALGLYERADREVATYKAVFGDAPQGRHLFEQALAVYALGREHAAATLLASAAEGRARESGLGLEMDVLGWLLKPDAAADKTNEDFQRRFGAGQISSAFSLFMPPRLLNALSAKVQQLPVS
jgi:Tfp pilus assembly protein PilF